MNKKDGMNYAPEGKVNKVVDKGEFLFAAIGLDHGHIYGMCNGLIEAGGELVAVYDPDAQKAAAFCEKYPSATVATSEQEILENTTIHLIASACIPVDRCELGLRVLDAGKHYFADKPAFTKKEQVILARKKVLILD